MTNLERVAMAIHKVASKHGACGQDCDHDEEARAAIKAMGRNRDSVRLEWLLRQDAFICPYAERKQIDDSMRGEK